MRDPHTTDSLLALAITHATGNTPPSQSTLSTVPPEDPTRLAVALTDTLGEDYTVAVTGTLDRRLLLLGHTPAGHADTGRWTAADLSGRAHRTRDWPTWTTGHLTVEQPDSWLSGATVTEQGLRRLLRPRVLLVSLYHPEHFPLPRFPLGISALARAARATLLGRVELLDMQLGADLDEVLARVTSGGFDIVGVSATFGQHDLLTTLLDAATAMPRPPMLLAGGSLTARNERLLLDRYPSLLVGRGAGEATVAGIVAHWHGDLELDQVPGLGYAGAPRGEGTLAIGRPRHTAVVANRARPDFLPELDLLAATFSLLGVAQLEFSRGCTNYCSFCPRGHKGQWAGATPADMAWMLQAIGRVFDRHPDLSRTLYLVDEEFIGGDDDAVPRALAAADTLHTAGFRWETSCRVDQVVRPDRDTTWHRERAVMWRGLLARGLRRCLFGVESGVTSVLERFNKETTGEQNALAIRTLTALGVPPRFTYITFDQLMDADELHATHAFQGRRDLLLRARPDLNVEEIVAGVRDEDWVAANSTGQPFYRGMSYMMVGMECLTGAAYTRKAEAAGLTGAADPSMGRVQARYLDWRIGVLAHRAQLWIDRNFPFDYTLKSLEKLLDGPAYDTVRDVRRMIKDAAYLVFGGMLHVLEATDPHTADRDGLDTACTEVCESMLDHLAQHMEPVVDGALADLPAAHRERLEREYLSWSRTRAWTLINAGDACGT